MPPKHPGEAHLISRLDKSKEIYKIQTMFISRRLNRPLESEVVFLSIHNPRPITGGPPITALGEEYHTL